MDLKQYEQKKFAIADIIRSAQAIDVQDRDLRDESRALLTRLAEDRFNLMVVGRFSRGKSTLMNAILGADLLPTGIVPLTSVITTVRYGSKKQVVLHFNRSGMPREVPMESLAEYVTQKHNPGNKKSVEFAEIQLPVEILRRGLFFVDSPGLGSAIAENSVTTENFLPQADAFVLVTSYESPLSEEEDRILQIIKQTGKALFVLLNKQDIASELERADALDFVETHLERLAFSRKPQVYSISARQGLEAKQARDDKGLEESGIHAFETELMRFLTEERAQSFVENAYQRTREFLERWSGRGSSEGERENFQEQLERLNGWKKIVLGESGGYAANHESIAVDTVNSYVLDINKKAGCQICGSIVDAALRFLSKYQYALTIDPETQQEHATRHGFCPLHTWQYEGISSPYGVCTAYPDLVHSLAASLKKLSNDEAEDDSRTDHLHSLLPTSETCRVCQVCAIAQKETVDALVANAQCAVRGSRFPACCLWHLSIVVHQLGKSQVASRLLAAHASLLERTGEDLQRYALRHDALRRSLTSVEERRSSQLALLLLAGHRSVSTPWRIDYLL